MWVYSTGSYACRLSRANLYFSCKVHMSQNSCPRSGDDTHQRHPTRFPATAHSAPTFPPGVLPPQLARSPALQRMFNLPALKPNGSKVVPMSRRSPEDSLLSTETSSTLVMTVPSQLTSENAKAVQADTPMMQDLSVGDDISIARADYSSPLTPLVDDSGRKTRERGLQRP